ncbi:MAG: long-chain-fatty-acid--CoA ligase [Candidatus Obscuribacterales bacterium]
MQRHEDSAELIPSNLLTVVISPAVPTLMNIWISLSKALSLWPNSDAIVDGDKSFTYRQFGERVGALSSWLEKAGIKRGDVVAIAAPNCHQYMEIYYACGIRGIVLTPLNFRLSHAELVAILQNAEAKLIFMHQDFVECAESLAKGCPQLKQFVWIDEADVLQEPETRVNHIYEDCIAGEYGAAPQPVDLQADELAHLYYTSGTTGQPKGVMLTQGNVSFNALGAIAELVFRETDTWLHAAPMFHLADAWSVFAITWVGGKHVFQPYFRAANALAAVEKHKVTMSVLVPTMLNAMLNEPTVGEYDYASLRVIITGGSPIAPETVKRVSSIFGCQYIQLYGMTETSPWLTIGAPLKCHDNLSEEDELQLRSRTGRPYIGAEVKVVRGNGEEVEKNNLEVGEIIARGPTITKGYWKNPEATAQTIRDGWIHTGDLAVIDKDGFINIVDRAKDMIITGGENVYSTEVEYALMEHPAVAECAVFGVPDERWGEVVHAVVVLRSAQTAEETDLIDFVKGRLAGYKAPRQVSIVKELPKTGSGKIYKKGLREEFWKERERQVN